MQLHKTPILGIMVSAESRLALRPNAIVRLLWSATKEFTVGRSVGDAESKSQNDVHGQPCCVESFLPTCAIANCAPDRSIQHEREPIPHAN